jgi:hypothetical protein
VTAGEILKLEGIVVLDLISLKIKEKRKQEHLSSLTKVIMNVWIVRGSFYPGTAILLIAFEVPSAHI